MKSINRIICILLALTAVSCGNTRKPVEKEIDPEQSLVDLLLACEDSTATFEDVYQKTLPLFEATMKMARTKDKLEDRFIAQKLVSDLLPIVMTKAAESGEIGDKLSKIIQKVGEINNQWLCDESDYGPHLYHSHYFVSYKGTDYEQDDIFSIDIVPHPDNSEKLYVWIELPYSASGVRMLLFTKDKDGKEDFDNYVAWNPLDVYPASEDEPSMAIAGNDDLLDMMLEFDHMYLFFETKEATDDGSNQDSFRLTLSYFKDEFSKVYSR